MKILVLEMDSVSLPGASIKIVGWTKVFVNTKTGEVKMFASNLFEG